MLIKKKRNWTVFTVKCSQFFFFFPFLSFAASLSTLVLWVEGARDQRCLRKLCMFEYLEYVLEFVVNFWNEVITSLYPHYRAISPLPRWKLE